MYYTERIEYLRECKELTQKDVAEFIGVKRTQYWRYEKGLNEMPLKYIEKLCKLYSVSADYLLGMTDNPRGSWLDRRR